jgi:hypothetical protein
MSWEMFTIPQTSTPPKAPLPDPLQNGSWYGEVWYRYPLSTSVLPMNFGHVFKVTSDFRVILNDITRVRVQTKGKYTAAQVANFGSRLRAWYTSMPTMLSPRHIVLPAHFMLQYVLVFS